MRRAGDAARLKTVLNGEIRTIREKPRAVLTMQREQFGWDHAALIKRQNAEPAKTREAWNGAKAMTRKITVTIELDDEAVDSLYSNR